MSDASPPTPPSPSAGRLATPSWLDARLVLGVLLVLVSVVVGARVLAAADRTQLVWQAARDLAPGTVLQEDDLRPVEVRLLSARDGYLAAPSRDFVGYVLERELLAEELVPVRALAAPDAADSELRLVSVPIQPGRFPADLARGQRVDVWSTPDPDAAAPPAAATSGATAGATSDATSGGEPAGTPTVAGGSRLVLAAVPVARRPEGGSALAGPSGESAVVLAVAPGDVAALVAAMSAGRIDLVRVPSSARAREELRSLGAGQG